jgi:hypothetical protein
MALSEKYQRVRDAAAESLEKLDQHPELKALLLSIRGFDVVGMLRHAESIEDDDDLFPFPDEISPIRRI